MVVVVSVDAEASRRLTGPDRLGPAEAALEGQLCMSPVAACCVLLVVRSLAWF